MRQKTEMYETMMRLIEEDPDHTVLRPYMTGIAFDLGIMEDEGDDVCAETFLYALEECKAFTHTGLYVTAYTQDSVLCK